MNKQQEAKIYLNDTRGKHELDWFRSFHTFNFGNYQNVHRQPVGSLYVLNDDAIAGGHSLQLETEEHTQVLLLPVVGAVTCNDTFIYAGQLLARNAPAGTKLNIANPYNEEQEMVNCLQLWFRSPALLPAAALILHAFSFENNMDKMLALTTGRGYPRVSIGKYMGRSKDRYVLKDTSCTLYAFVIEGAFEVEDRLLHARDGLALNNFDTIEFEALSNEAILLLIEVPVV
ncbi:MAG: pirin [Sediminibacterium sp.]|nr:pirin [Sediminibacterium sp.]